MIAKVLTVGLDQILIDSRASILSSRYETATARPEETLSCLKSQSYDLLLVCHSIPQDEASALIRSAHEAFPHLCIVRLLTLGQALITKPIAHKLVTVDFRPELWMKAVDDLLAPGTLAAFSDDSFA